MIRGLDKSQMIDRVVFKKTFFDNGKFSYSERNLFTQSVDKVMWKYSLKPSNLFVKAYEDEERSYPEMEVFTVKLKTDKNLQRVCELIMRSIPYPMLIILEYCNKEALVVAHYRINKNDSSKNTIGDMQLTLFESHVSEKLDFKRFRFTNFYELYCDLVDEVSLLIAQQRSLDTHSLSGDDARVMILELDRIEREITRYRNELKNEDQFNRQMELNMIIKRLQLDKKELLSGGE